MSDDEFEFIDDTPKKKSAAAPKKSANVDPFADVRVDTNAEDTSAPEPSEKDVAPTDASSSAGERKNIDAFGDAGGAINVGAGEKPELWKCPHCGAKNVPNRTECRACGKTIDDDVVIPLQHQPWFRFGVPAVIAIVIIFIVMSLGSVDRSVVSPSAATIDSDIRFIDQDASGEFEVGDETFTAYGNIGFVGRVLAVSEKGGIHKIQVLFGRMVIDDNHFEDSKLTSKGVKRNNIQRSEPYARITLMGDGIPAMEKGQYISLVGLHGESDNYEGDLSRNEHVVFVTSGQVQVAH